MFKNGATIFSNQLGDIGNILANNKNGKSLCELSSIYKKNLIKSILNQKLE